MFNPNLMYLNNDQVYSNVTDREMPDYKRLRGRIRKTLYYGKYPKLDRPSLPLTGIAVEHFQERCPRKLGKLDMYRAAEVTRNACVSPCSLMLSMIYLKRLRGRNPEYVQNVSSSDAFLISMMVASKFLYDEGVEDEVFNDEWAQSASMDVEDVNELERDFLSAIDWNLFASGSDLGDVLEDCEKRIARSQGVDRGWFSYSDLNVLLDTKARSKLVKMVLFEMSKVVMVCSVAYVAGFLTLVSSCALTLHVRQTAVSRLPTFALPADESRSHPEHPQTENETTDIYPTNETATYGAPLMNWIQLSVVTDALRAAHIKLGYVSTTVKHMYVWSQARSNKPKDSLTRCRCSQGCCPHGVSKNCVNATSTHGLRYSFMDPEKNEQNYEQRSTCNDIDCSNQCARPIGSCQQHLHVCCCYHGDSMGYQELVAPVLDVNIGFTTNPHIILA